jgi:hypothetical protein
MTTVRPAWHMFVATCSALVALLSSSTTRADGKAFVIGNAAYAKATALPNPVNDARALASRLTGLGYKVTLVTDAPRVDFLAAFQAFARSLAANDLALFYYAGHGLQIGGENYLFPVDAHVEKEADVRTALVSLNALLADLTRTARNRIVILDACRDNPFAEPIATMQATRSAGTTRGLARVYAGVGSYIAFSTQPGNTALDGAGNNSPFTASLLQHIGETGADVHGVMRRVRGDVQRATAEAQVPWENSSLVDEVAFVLTAKNGPAVAAPSIPPAPARPKPETPPAEPFHYVTGLDPAGDNFLALRSSTGPDGVRIATMGPGTLLKIVGSSGPWKQVVLRDGTQGWAHGNWIACCRTPGEQRQSAVTTAPRTCDTVWTERNALWHRAGYCFTTDRAKQVFGNAGCSRNQDQARAAMPPTDRARVEQLAEIEKQMGCR